MFEVGATTRFVAYHVMPAQPPPENERHAHDYRVEVVAGRDELDERGMVCDLGVVTSCLAGVADELRDRDLSDACGPREVTVEVLAAWIHRRLAPKLESDGAETLAVRVWESDDAFGGIRDRL